MLQKCCSWTFRINSSTKILERQTHKESKSNNLVNGNDDDDAAKQQKLPPTTHQKVSARKIWKDVRKMFHEKDQVFPIVRARFSGFSFVWRSLLFCLYHWIYERIEKEVGWTGVWMKNLWEKLYWMNLINVKRKFKRRS